MHIVGNGNVYKLDSDMFVQIPKTTKIMDLWDVNYISVNLKSLQN